MLKVPYSLNGCSKERAFAFHFDYNGANESLRRKCFSKLESTTGVFATCTKLIKDDCHPSCVSLDTTSNYTFQLVRAMLTVWTICACSIGTAALLFVSSFIVKYTAHVPWFVVHSKWETTGNQVLYHWNVS